MHIHTESEHIHTKSNKNDLKSKLIQFGISLLVLLTVPWGLSQFTKGNVEEIRKGNPQIANRPSLGYYKAKVEKVKGEIKPDNNNQVLGFQELEVKTLEGPEKGQIFNLETQVNPTDDFSKYKEGDELVLMRTNSEDQVRYYVSERYRLNQLLFVAIAFIFLVIVLVGIRGLTAVSGLMFSVLTLITFLIPLILSGQNVILVTFLTGLFILTISFYLSHGFRKAISISLIASIITITLATLGSILVVYFTRLSGTGSEDAFNLLYSNTTGNLNFRGLLLSAIIIGSLGVIDDVTTTQSTTVEELAKANPKLTTLELYQRGMKVGQEHIISVVNTLGLAYVSVAMPLIMYLTIYNQTPLWVTLNSEMIAEEVIRTLVGSATLLLAVPITTILSARFLRNPKPESLQTTTVKEPAPISNSPKIAKSSFKPKLLNPFKKLSFFNKPKKTASLDKLDKSLKTPKLQNLSDEDQLVNKLKEFNTLLEQKANQTQENVLEDDYNIITDSQKPETKEPLPASNSTQTQNLPEQNKPVTPSQSKQPEPFQDYEQNPSVSDFPEATQTKKRIQL
jgi:uncharacterized membrane protein